MPFGQSVEFVLQAVAAGTIAHVGALLSFLYMDKNGIVAEGIIRRKAVIIGVGNTGLGFHLSVAVAAIERAGEFACGEIIVPVSHGQHVLGVNFVIAEMQARVVAIAGGK